MRNDEPVINGAIRSPVVRLVSENGDQSIIPIKEALAVAHSAGLDLVQFSNSNPPVVKIINYSKYKFEQQKKLKEAAKKNRASRVELKELQFRPVTDDNDVKRLIKQANGFLDKGNKVKFVCKFRGRENAHRENGLSILHTILEGIKGIQEGSITNQDRNISVIISPTN